MIADVFFKYLTKAAVQQFIGLSRIWRFRTFKKLPNCPFKRGDWMISCWVLVSRFWFTKSEAWTKSSSPSRGKPFIIIPPSNFAKCFKSTLSESSDFTSNKWNKTVVGEMGRCFWFNSSGGMYGLQVGTGVELATLSPFGGWQIISNDNFEATYGAKD